MKLDGQLDDLPLLAHGKFFRVDETTYFGLPPV
jgi:hypothetical protein